MIESALGYRLPGCNSSSKTYHSEIVARHHYHTASGSRPGFLVVDVSTMVKLSLIGLVVVLLSGLEFVQRLSVG
jgi:hypothetical protein